jgi:hypothetical protein
MQAALRCAQLHLRWSTMEGGTVGEDGRYDVWATLVEILRVKASRPELAPEEYHTDERFRCGHRHRLWALLLNMSWINF